MVYKTKNAHETQSIATNLAVTLRPGDIVALYGDLGAGKTTFVQGLAKALGVKETVNSPTFLTIKPYGTFIHADLYRLKSKADVDTTGLEEYLGSSQYIVAIEWPEIIENLLPKKTKKIYFESKDDNTREITIH